jgi:hypothetical protein
MTAQITRIRSRAARIDIRATLLQRVALFEAGLDGGYGIAQPNTALVQARLCIADARRVVEPLEPQRMVPKRMFTSPDRAEVRPMIGKKGEAWHDVYDVPMPIDERDFDPRIGCSRRRAPQWLSASLLRPTSGALKALELTRSLVGRVVRTVRPAALVHVARMRRWRHGNVKRPARGNLL